VRFKPARLRREVQHEADLAGETARRETEAQQAELVARIREEAEAAAKAAARGARGRLRRLGNLAPRSAGG
jgi:hypothetical protein